MQVSLEPLFHQTEFSEADHALFAEFRQALEQGTVRAAEPDSSSETGWRTNAWVKQAILLGFRMGAMVDHPGGFVDKATYPAQTFTVAQGVRFVPGGSSVRSGAFLASSVVMMPPSYVNVGAYVGAKTMIDSHVLVGSCAQIGELVHLSAAVQVGGVLEPIGASPVIVENGAMIGGNCGLYEGVIVKSRAVLGTGVILNRSTPVYDLVTGQIHRAQGEQPLVIPAGAVVVAGSRPAKGDAFGGEIHLYTPVIVKYRDESTDSRVQLEEFLR